MPRDEEISVVLVDEDDNVVGFGDKLDVHKRGLLHRAFSVFVYDDQGRLLLQQRADSKYHAGGKWANTVCGHPFAGEGNAEAAERRLREELGISLHVTPITSLYYKQEVDAGMIEHEYVHVFEATYQDELIKPDPMEVQQTRWLRPEEIRKEVLAEDLGSEDSVYAAWFAHYVRDFYDVLFERRKH